MTLMTTPAPVSSQATPAPRVVQPRSVILASINRPEGDTGVHTHGRMLAEGLRDAGVSCDVISAFGGSAKWLAVFAVRPLFLQRINKTWATLWHRKYHAAALRENLRRRLSECGADAIVAQCPVSASVAMDVRRDLALDIPVAMVCHFNGSEASEYRDKGELAGDDQFNAMLAFEKRVLESVDRVIYVSDWARRNVENDRKLNTRSSTVIWNGVAKAQATTVSRSELGAGDGDVVLINVGSIEPRKNQINLIDLFAAIYAANPKTKLVLVGDGAQRDAVEAKVAEKNLANAVKLLGHRRDVPALLAAADVYVHYSLLENCPLVLIEAARAGLPVAAVPAGGVPELQNALDCKFDLDPADVTGSAARLSPLLTSENFRHECGARAKAAFERTFTQESMTQAYLNALTFARSS